MACGKKRKLKNMTITHVSAVDKAANKTTFFLMKDENPTFEKIIDIIKSNDNFDTVYGIVYSPDEIDAQGEFSTAEEIEKAAHEYLKNYREMDTNHDYKTKSGDLVESAIALNDMSIGNTTIKKGSWYVAFKPTEIVKEAIKKGEITGFSMAGKAEIEEVEEDEKNDGVLKNLVKKLIGLVKADYEDAKNKEEMHEKTWRIQSVFTEILFDPNLTMQGKIEALNNSYQQFLKDLQAETQEIEKANNKTIKKGDTMNKEKLLARLKELEATVQKSAEINAEIDDIKDKLSFIESFEKANVKITDLEKSQSNLRDQSIMKKEEILVNTIIGAYKADKHDIKKAVSEIHSISATTDEVQIAKSYAGMIVSATLAKKAGIAPDWVQRVEKAVNAAADFTVAGALIPKAFEEWFNTIVAEDQLLSRIKSVSTKKLSNDLNNFVATVVARRPTTLNSDITGSDVILTDAGANTVLKAVQIVAALGFDVLIDNLDKPDFLATYQQMITDAVRSTIMEIAFTGVSEAANAGNSTMAYGWLYRAKNNSYSAKTDLTNLTTMLEKLDAVYDNIPAKFRNEGSKFVVMMDADSYEAYKRELRSIENNAANAAGAMPSMYSGLEVMTHSQIPANHILMVQLDKMFFMTANPDGGAGNFMFDVVKDSEKYCLKHIYNLHLGFNFASGHRVSIGYNF